MSKIVGWLLDFIPPQALLVVTGVALLGLGVVSLGYQLSLNHARSELETTRSELTLATASLAICHGNMASLKASIAEQNAAIDGMRKQGEVQDAQAAARVAMVLAKPIKPATGHGAEAVNTWLSNLVTQ